MKNFLYFLIFFTVSCFNNRQRDKRITTNSNSIKSVNDSLPKSNNEKINYINWIKTKEYLYENLGNYYNFHIFWEKGDSIIEYGVESSEKEKLSILNLNNLYVNSTERNISISFTHPYKIEKIDSSFRRLNPKMIKSIFVKSKSDTIGNEGELIYDKKRIIDFFKSL